MTKFIEALFAYRQALDAYWAEATRRKLGSDYYRAGRQCRKALRRVRRIAAQQRLYRGNHLCQAVPVNLPEPILTL